MPARRILVVDDDEVHRRLVRRALAQAMPEAEVVEAGDGAQALAAAAAGPAFDLVLLDYVLPDVDGAELLAGLRRRGLQAPVLALTGHGDEAVAVRMMKAGASDYLPKRGLTAAAIARAVEGLLGAARGGGPGAAPPPPPSPGLLVEGRYLLARELGAGAVGRVFLSRDEVLGRDIVLKFLRPERAPHPSATAQFLREARIAARLEHPRIVRVYDYGVYGGAPYVVMEHAEGGSLADLLGRAGRLPAREACRVLDQVLEGLAFMHARGVFHGDLKPANILLPADGSVKLADFGLSVLLEEDATSTNLSAAGGAAGTPAYMSPEAVRGEALTAASDVYSAGAVLFHLLAGEPYLRLAGRTPEAVRMAILAEPPQAMPGIAPALREVVARALEKEPARRFAGAEAMARALRAAARAGR